MFKFRKILVLCIILTIFNILSGCETSRYIPEPTYMMPDENLISPNSPYLPMTTIPFTEPVHDQTSIYSQLPSSLEDWVSILHYEEFIWTDDVGNQNKVSVTLPAINPVFDSAAAYNEQIRIIGQKVISEITECVEFSTSCPILRVSFEAYLNDSILSIVLIHQYDADYTEYLVHSFNLSEGRQINLSDFCFTYLGLDYPGFIYATNKLIENEFEDKFGSYGIEHDPELYHQIKDEISLDALSILDRNLFIGENGQLMLLYNAPSMAGAAYYPTIKPFDIRQIGLIEEPTDEESYEYLFRLVLQADDIQGSACQQILKKAFDEDADDFSEELSKQNPEQINTIVAFLVKGYGIETEKLAQYAQYLQEENVKEAILNELEANK